jgi:hypothetical protein
MSVHNFHRGHLLTRTSWVTKGNLRLEMYRWILVASSNMHKLVSRAMYLGIVEKVSGCTLTSCHRCFVIL